MNCYVYVIVRQCILYCISFELPCRNVNLKIKMIIILLNHVLI